MTTILPEKLPCPCVRTHVPKPGITVVHHVWPKGMGGPDEAANRIGICPTTHYAVHQLLDAYKHAGGQPSWDFQKHFSGFVRKLAYYGWQSYQEKRVIPRTDMPSAA